MEDQDRAWPSRPLSFKSRAKQLLERNRADKSGHQAADVPSRADPSENAKPSRKPSFRSNLQKNFDRIRRPNQPALQEQRDQQLHAAQSMQERLQPDRPLPIPQQYPPVREPLRALPRNENMSLVDQPAARNNERPVRPQRSVIDLTAGDEEEDAFFPGAQEMPHIKEERNAVVRREQERLARMGDAVPALAFAEHAPYRPDPENAYVRPRDVWGDYDLDYDSDDAFQAADVEFAQGDAFLPPPAGHVRPVDRVPAPVPRAAPPIQDDLLVEIIESRMDCVDSILTVFPGICGEYVSELYESISQSSATLIAHILDKMDKGSAYPSAKEKQQKKRKREVDEDTEAARRYGALDRVIPNAPGGIRSFISKILSCEFPLTSMVFINATLEQTGYRLFSAHQVLEEAERTWTRENPSYQRLKKPRKDEGLYTDKVIADYLADPTINQQAAGIVDHEKTEVFQELQAARRIRSKADAQRVAELQAEIAEEENVAKAEAEGTMGECQCCWCDYPLNRMVHCDSETLHWFCRGCAKQTAEVEIGKSKYELICMSTDKCSASFSHDQRSQFLDDNIRVALERNEQEAMLRLAGIENLESCPFCPFAMEYPDVEIDREFRCQAPDCEKISCRLCRVESHIPKTCAEHSKENGLSIRRLIEEAMSAAMIRKCNKCGTPFVKEEGCNKMTCTRNGCRNVQCYVCSKSCDYNHFNDTSRGGMEGNCPLFESVEERHDDEVKKAEKEALEKVLADHPEYSEQDLKVKMSENVQKDDEARKSKDPRAMYEMAMRVGQENLELNRLAEAARLEAAAGRDVPAAPLEARIREHNRGLDFFQWHEARIPRPIPVLAPQRQPGGQVGHRNPANGLAQHPAELVVPLVDNLGAPAPGREPLGLVVARVGQRLRGLRNRGEVVQNRHQAELDAAEGQVDGLRDDAQREVNGMRDDAQRRNNSLRRRNGAREDARLVADKAVHANNRKVDDEVPRSRPGNPNADGQGAMMQGLAAPALAVERNPQDVRQAGRLSFRNLQIFQQLQMRAAREHQKAAAQAQAAPPAPLLVVPQNPHALLMAARRRRELVQQQQQERDLMLGNQRAMAANLAQAAIAQAPFAQAPFAQAAFAQAPILPAPAAKQNPEDPHAAAQRLNQEYQLFHRNMIRANQREYAVAQGNPLEHILPGNHYGPIENARRLQHQQQIMQPHQLIRALENGDPPVLGQNPYLAAQRAQQLRHMENQPLQNRMPVDPEPDFQIRRKALPHQLPRQPPPPYAENDVVMQDAPPPPAYLPQGRQRSHSVPARENQAIANPAQPLNPGPGPDIDAHMAGVMRQLQAEIQLRQEMAQRHMHEQMQMQLQAQRQVFYNQRLIADEQQEAELRQQAGLHRQIQAQMQEQRQRAYHAPMEARIRADIIAQQVRQYHARASGLPADGRLAFAGRAGHRNGNANNVLGGFAVDLAGIGGGNRNGNAIGAAGGVENRAEALANGRGRHARAMQDIDQHQLRQEMRRVMHMEGWIRGEAGEPAVHIPEEVEEEFESA
ncbi:uncharacterized protein RSE6_13058 [Rhynchosporium secalis]|uniref:RING-type domain-containing protein n=1 Tax=Rhynchosporium secalis TaxID=38038 RepID=A0A1E1MRY4_RHYSE|nr:uncharacterized protein RSE6_13058 [Rhynchosporium secalis]